MKIQCQSCQAKYTIADEKVLGKVVKIRCKKCSSTIVINGNETRPHEDNVDTHVFDYAGQANDPWTVNVADGDQRTMTSQEIAAEYKTGVVNDETYCWKDGMADWLPLREIEPLYAAVKMGPGRPPQESLHDDISVPPQSIPAPASNAAALFAANEANGNVESPFAGTNGNTNGNGNGYGHTPEPAPAAAAERAERTAAAARRGGGRGQGADLFGNAASAGGEDDVMTSAATGSSSGGGGGGGGLEEHKLTGQRNESSVLFSLSALTEGNKPEPASRTTATADGSGLIDIRALSQTMGADEKKDNRARVDDIMNLSGGGAFGAALAAPILAPPPLEMASDYASGGGQQKSNNTLIIAIIAGALLIAIGIVVAVFLLRPAPITTATDNTGSTASAMTATASAGSPAGTVTAPSTAATDTAAAAAAAGSGSAGATADNTPAPPGTGNATTKPAAVTGAPTHMGGATGAPTHVADTTPPPAAAPAQPAKPADFGSALAAAAGQPAAPHAAAPAAAGTAPFDRGAAQAAIGSVNAQSCKKPDGPTGGGHVKITFAPDGSVSAAVLDSGPFTGTPVGGCIAGKYRAPHIPAFSGGAITVGKSFNIN